MSRDETRMLVNVFETIGHAERAVGALLGAGHHAGQIAVIETVLEATGLGARLSGLGVPTDLADYYETEVRAGRVLVAVRYHLSNVDDVRAILAQAGGTIRMPPEVRNDRA